MEQIAEARKGKNGNARKGGVVCPSLVLAVRVVCDRGGTVVEPTRSHLWEYCTTELHDQCSLWSASAMQ